MLQEISDYSFIVVRLKHTVDERELIAFKVALYGEKRVKSGSLNILQESYQDKLTIIKEYQGKNDTLISFACTPFSENTN